MCVVATAFLRKGFGRSPACAKGFKAQQRRALEPPEHVIRHGRVREFLGILLVAQMRDP